MNDDYVMRPGDKFVASECGCSVTVITGPSDPSMAVQAPRCCCGHDMVKSNSFVGGIDVLDIQEPIMPQPILAGMVE